MKKKLLLRERLGFPSDCHRYVITICISLMWAGGITPPARRSWRRRWEMRSASVILQALSADCCARASRQAPYQEMESWSIARKTACISSSFP